ncbi:calcium-binding protein [Oscillatoriales cyanobacterium LEGE 11467]|uniref:Calcium-binding protein n=1 Tax=Zarconia navalis LEGE 11467 TaxID=1828826 RepID=A0A928VTY2_9CYAN|nr:calcium-binding protein [Zarconia navalis]MBE9040294.1 calcium-binding protein [Zarconia navalis LEGE 11467]
MSQVLDPTTPVSSTPNQNGGLDIQGSQGTSNRLNGGASDDLISTATLDEVLAGVAAGVEPGALGTGDVIDAGEGNDVVFGLGGDDSVSGSQGNDQILTNQGNDTVDGGEGSDAIFAGQGNDIVDGGEDNDLISGDLGNDVVSGGSGDDAVYGGQGNDNLLGGEGNDLILGGQGDDVISGGAGNDVMAGDRGNDTITGGDGEDRFVFGGVFNSTVAELGLDSITDFSVGEDKISLSQFTFAQVGDSLTAAEFSTTTAFDSNADGASAAKVIYDSTTGLIYYNPTEAVGDEVAFAQVDPNLALSADSFEVF